ASDVRQDPTRGSALRGSEWGEWGPASNEPGFGAEPHITMSGLVVSRALHHRFESIRQHEVERLEKKLRGLSDAHRESVEAITVEVIQALARGAERALANDMPRPELEALVRLFALENDIQ